MKIVTWNCNGALRKKTHKVDRLNADILLIQECEDPARSTHEYRDWAGNYLWAGTSKNKGIGVFAKNQHTIKSLAWYGEFNLQSLVSKSPSLHWKTSDLNLFLPFIVNNSITILGVWTKGNDSQIFGYMGQFWKYLQIHRNELNNNKIMLLGDFNSNAIWDKVDRWWSHSDVIDELGDIGIRSLYHEQYNEAQGQETRPTFYLHRKEEKAYHIDYAFMSNDLLENATLTIGKKDNWIDASDHMPLSIKIHS